MSKTNTSRRHKKEKEINPALKIRDFYSFGLQILNEINNAREHPDEFLEKLKELQGTIEDSKDNCLFIENVPFIYTNLSGSLNDAINFLENQKELPKLIYNKAITQACDHLLDELVSHDGLDDENADDFSLENRLNKFGHPFGENYELIDYGMFDPEFIVINFILGDGDKNKFERNIIFNPKVKYVGIASGILSSEKICTIINFCEEYYDLSEKIPANIEKKYNKLTPSFNTKTINNYSGKTGKSTNVERYTSNTKKEGNTEEQFTEEINSKKGDSGDVYSVKKTEYIKRHESIKHPDDYQKLHEDRKDGRLINKKTKNETKDKLDFFNDDEDDFDNDDFFDKEFDMDFDKDFRGKKKASKKTTTTTTTMDENGAKRTVVTTVTEEIDDSGNTKKELYEEEENDDDHSKYPQIKGRKNKINERPKRERENQIRKKQEYIEQEEYEEEEDKNNNINNNIKINPKKEIEKKEINYNIIQDKNNNKTDNKNDIRYQIKIIEIPIKLKPKKEEQDTYDDSNSSQKYSTYQTYDNRRQHRKRVHNNEFEEEEFDNEYPTEFREEKRKKNIIPEDVYENEEEMELPEGAANMKVKQKVIKESNGELALIIRKTITYEDGTVKTLIEKKPINQK